MEDKCGSFINISPSDSGLDLEDVKNENDEQRSHIDNIGQDFAELSETAIQLQETIHQRK